MKKEKPLSEEIEYLNEISPDFIGDNPREIQEGTVTPIGYIKAEKVKRKFKEILDEIAPSEYSKYLKEHPKSDLTFWGFQRQIIKQKAGFGGLE